MDPQDDNEESGPSILEVLNAYCFRFIFDCLSINDLVRSERVSRAWRSQVHYYLTGVQNFRIELDSNVCSVADRYSGYRLITLSRLKMLYLKDLILKMGQYFVRLDSNCITEEGSKAIAECCPRLESLTLTGRHMKSVFEGMSFEHNDVEFPGVDNATLDSWLLTGIFLWDLRANLKTFGLSFFTNLSFSHEHILAAANRFTGLTRLELSFNTPETLRHVSVLLDQMPLLEHLSLMEYEQHDEPDINPPCYDRLTRLRELHLWGNEYVKPSWLKTAARCKALRTLNIGICSRLTPPAIINFCTARPELTELVVAGLDVTDADLGACARRCGNLQVLDASWCPRLTRDVLRSIERPRPNPLVFRLRATSVPKRFLAMDYQGIKVRLDITPDVYNPLHRHFDSGDSDHYALCGSDCEDDCDHDLAPPAYYDSDDDDDDGVFVDVGMPGEDFVYSDEDSDEDMYQDARRAEGLDEEGFRPEGGVYYGWIHEGMVQDRRRELGLNPEVMDAEEGIVAEEGKEAEEGLEAEEGIQAEEAVQEEGMRPEEGIRPDAAVQPDEGRRQEAGVHEPAMRPVEARNPEVAMRPEVRHLEDRIQEGMQAEVILPVEPRQAEDLPDVVPVEQRQAVERRQAVDLLPIERRQAEDLLLPVDRRVAEDLLLVPVERRPIDALLLAIEQRFAEYEMLPQHDIQGDDVAENVVVEENPDDDIRPIIEMPDDDIRPIIEMPDDDMPPMEDIDDDEEQLFIENGFNEDPFEDIGIEPLHRDPRNGWYGIDIALPNDNQGVAHDLVIPIDAAVHRAIVIQVAGGPFAGQDARQALHDLRDAYIIEDDDMMSDEENVVNGVVPGADDVFGHAHDV